jgi:hypothetical protein
MVIIDRCKSHQKGRPATERPSTFGSSKNMLGIERMAFDRKGLVGFQPFPTEVACFGKSSHLVRAEWKFAGLGPKTLIGNGRVPSSYEAGRPNR